MILLFLHNTQIKPDETDGDHGNLEVKTQQQLRHLLWWYFNSDLLPANIGLRGKRRSRAACRDESESAPVLNLFFLSYSLFQDDFYVDFIVWNVR